MKEIYPTDSKYAKDLVVGDKIHYSFTVKTIVSIVNDNGKLTVKFSDDDIINSGLFAVYFICNAYNSEDFVV